ncbi:MAG TPA: DNA recombination protein RecN [Epsilonproteobacteria bacterium]|nr:DNA recombination protein RecN [Campylobacterota bacterium]
MIERLLVKELLDFESLKLDFDDSLVVFTGPSGAGKSVLMGALLSNFGYSLPTYASLCEATINRPKLLDSELYELEDIIVVKSIKKDKVRYYLNDQNIPKKSLKNLFDRYVHYLSVRDKKAITSQDLIDIIDRAISSKDPNHSFLLAKLQETFSELKNAKLKLEEIYNNESKLADKIEMANFEIKKIDTINPKIGEDEYLLSVKQQLTRLDKLKDALQKAEMVFEFEQKVIDLYSLSDKSSEFFEDAMNQLRIDIDEIASKSLELQDIDIEEVLDRIEAISELKNRYGSIEDALLYRDKKRKELESYESMEQDKSKLKLFIDKQTKLLKTLCQDISQARINELDKLKKRLDQFLAELKLPKATFEVVQIEPSDNGFDEINLVLGDSSISTLSGGEFNRLRLALLVASTTTSTSENKGVIILDEIDANVSGDESIAIANMLLKLSSSYQIFAISHQPHLASKAHQHILIYKDGKSSHAIPLDANGRIKEIARIIDGKEATTEAIDFAKKLLG